jgi:hypothetical protein
MGKIAKSLLEDGVKLGVSSRGLGSIVEKDGINFVGEDFMLATAADIVADPSAPDAFVEGIMEGKEWIWESGMLREVELNRLKQSINEATRFDLQERKIKAFAAFLKGL